MKRPRKALCKLIGRKANRRRAKLRTRLAGPETLEQRRVLDSTVVFNEIMYNPLDDANDELEWIELHNQLAVDMDISEWHLEGGVEFDFPDGTIVPGKGYLVIAANPMALEASSGFAGALGPLVGRLSNGGEELRLFNNDGRRMNVVDYGDNGDWPVEPDGGGSSLAKGDHLSNSEDAENWTFSSQIGGTPGRVNVVSVERVQFNEIAAADQENFFIEIANDGGGSIDVGGYVLSVTGVGGGDYVLPAGMIPAGEWLVVTGDDLPFRAVDGARMFLYSPGKERLIDARVVTNSLRGRSDEHDGRWLWPDLPTPSAANSFAFQDQIVINEILYHAPPQLRTAEQPYAESSEEWIELYNRGDEPVDLSGWRLRDAVEFEFVVGTMIGPGEYLVVANDAVAVKAKHGIENVVGNFDRSLSNSDDRILLVDANKNPADEVHYFERGKWSEFADGGGSSLELRDPGADNSQGAAWGPSNQADGSQWIDYSYTASAVEPICCGNEFNELVLGLLDAGEFLIDDIEVRRGGGANMIRNSTFQGDRIGSSPANWRFNGNHFGTIVADPDDPNPDNPSTRVLHVTAAGPQQHINDNIDITLTQSVNSSIHTISFRIKWLTGSAQLNSRLFYTRMSNTAIMDVPTRIGTPGEQNSAFESNIGPTYSEFGHFPVLPRTNQPVTVSVQAQDNDGVTSLKLWYGVNGSNWQSVTMEKGPDGRFAAQIPGSVNANNRVVQFYVEGRDSRGMTSTFPAAGRASRAMYQVDADGRESTRPIDTFRLVQLSTDVNAMFGNRYQQMSNLFRGTTLIVNGETAFYDVSVRLIGSGFIRPNSGYKVRLDPEQRFYGVHDSIRFDIDLPGEIILKQMVNRAGGSSVSMYDDISYLVSPRHNIIMQLQLVRYENIYLNEQFENGSDGTKFELDDVTRPSGGGGSGFHTGRSMAAMDVRNAGPNPEAYRGQLLIKSRRAKDNFAAMAAFSQAIHQNGSFVGSPLDLATQEVLDVDLWMRHYATQAFIGNWDTYGFGRPKNLRIYVRPEDGKIIPFYWDADRHRLGDALIFNGGQTRLDEIRNIPTNTRLFWGHMLDLTERAFNQAYTTRWVAHYASLGVNGQDSAAAIGSRANQARSEAERAIPRINFALTSPRGSATSTPNKTIDIAGVGWINVREIRLKGSDAALDVKWTGVNSWTITLPVAFGKNELTFEAYDFRGNLISSLETIEVTSTSQEPRVADLLRLSELMYNPADPPASSKFDNDQFEYIELVNISNEETIQLEGVHFTRGVTFDFTDSEVTSLDVGGRVIVVRNLEAFSERYADSVKSINIAGVYEGKLNNGGEGLALVDSLGLTAFDFSYKDGWYDVTDGGGFSLTVRDPEADPRSLSEKSAWQPSALVAGSPGSDDQGPAVGAVVINEILTHTDASDTGDWIELFNTTDEAIDLSGWYLSDSNKNLQKYRIPDGTMIPGGGYLTFNQFGPGGFGVHPLSGDPLSENSLGNPGAFGLSELGGVARLTSVDPTRIRENIDAVHVLENGHIVLSTATKAVLGINALSFRDGDLIEYDPTTGMASLVLSESIFLDPFSPTPADENVDALSVLSGGDLVLSTSGSARIGELSFRDGDLVRYNPTTGAAVLLFSEDFFTGGGDIDAVHIVENDAGQIERIIISTDNEVTIDGVRFDDGDLIEIELGASSNLAEGRLGDGTVRRYLSESVFAIGSGSLAIAENIDAVHLTGGGAIVLSTTGNATLADLPLSFGNGDLIQLRPGTDADLGNGELGNGAQATLLFEEDPESAVTFYGEPAGYREKVDFAGADREVSFGLHNRRDGLSDFVAQVDSSKGLPNGAPRIGPIVFNEVMYNPAEGPEFIELRNISDEPVTLFDPAHPENTWVFTAGIEFAFPQGVTLPSGGLALVVPVVDVDKDDFASFRAAHGVPADVPIFGPYAGRLDNGGEKIELSRPGDPDLDLDGGAPMIVVSRLEYDDVAPWPTQADGLGWSLQLKTPDEYGNDAINWGITIPSGTPGDFVIPAQVTEVLLWGSQWSEQMLDRLASDGLGEGGVSIPSGTNQLQTVAWSGIDRLSIRFSEQVNIKSDQIEMFGVNSAEFEFSGFTYDPASFTATWSLEQPLRADKLRIVLSDAVTDLSGLPLDGGWTDTISAFPSGDGAVDSDDDFSFRFNVLPGDVVAGKGVNRRDLVDVIHHLGGSTQRGPYDPRLDINADGLIDTSDLREMLQHLGSQIPSREPGSISGSVAAIATDAVFDRVGAAAAAPQLATRAERDTSPRTSSEASNEARTSRHRRPLDSSVVESSDGRLARRRVARGRRAAIDTVHTSLSVEPSALRERITGTRRGDRRR